eukprot:TRINITY_DN9933_c0_g1_i1.p1 TRINITY_DN9933_c0_g1~~TRINITY_DN9933_c0_g1_i1.p1  ORF type:complete len:357 (+),score=91.08 TRINITY_DN9933_c0_g1_i1:65-1072(+)
MEKYEKAEELGRGTFGTVFAATVKATGERVAIKRINLGNTRDDVEGIHFTALREIKYLQENIHPHVVSLLDVFSDGTNLHLVFDLMETDLKKIIDDKPLFLSKEDIRAYMWMLVQGVAHLHKHGILHRDLKPENLLISSSGQLKITDFGLARRYGSPREKLTNTAVTIFYRPPELLFGAEKYGFAVDMWSVGCIFAELLLRLPYFPGHTELQMIQNITAALGSPRDWPEMEQMPLFFKVEPRERPDPRQLFSAATDDEIAFLEQLLQWNPNKRMTAAQALQHRYFSGPRSDPSQLKLPTKRGPQPIIPPNVRSRLQDMEDENIGNAKRRLDWDAV